MNIEIIEEDKSNVTDVDLLCSSYKGIQNVPKGLSLSF